MGANDGGITGMSGEPRYSLRLLSAENFRAFGICGGKIGKGDKMCVRQDCSISTHGTNKIWESILTNDEDHYFVEANEFSVFCKPVIAAAALGDRAADGFVIPP